MWPIRFEELRTLINIEEDLLKSAKENSKEISHMAMATNKSSPSNFNSSSVQFNANKGRGGCNQNRGLGGRFQNFNNGGNFNNYRPHGSLTQGP